MSRLMELLEGKVLQSNENKCAYKPIKNSYLIAENTVRELIYCSYILYLQTF